MNNKINLDNLEKIILYNFNNKSLLIEALTHSSYANEKNINFNYERLEFLGDAVLELTVSCFLIEKYKDFAEGQLSSIRSYIVSEKFLSKKAKELDIDKYIFISSGVIKVSKTVNNSILADVFEAIIGAMYLDSNFDKTKEIVLKLISSDIDLSAKEKIIVDAKGEIQKYTQIRYGTLPQYTVIKEEGPDHNKVYTVKLIINNELSFIGVASTKKNAEKEAALEALKRIY